MSANVLVREDFTIPRSPTAPARIGLLGCGVVGSAVARALLDDRPTAVAGESWLDLTRVAVRHPGKKRPVALPPGVLCGDAYAVVDDPDVDVVVEVIGGIDVPRSLLLRALRNGKSVVTANKALVALHGRELAAEAEHAEVDLLFEAAVAGAVPVVSLLRDRLSAATKERVIGVVNGTSNFVLERMAEDGLSQEAAIAEAQRLGYAEADPGADLDGSDAASKLAILASLTFGRWVAPSHVARRGIAGVGLDDVACARAGGHEIKLIACAERRDGVATLSVSPSLVPRSSTLATLPGVTNEVTVTCRGAGPISLRGLGAGGDATASAIVGDLIAAVRNRLAGTRSPLPVSEVAAPPRRSAEVSRFFVRVDGRRSSHRTAQVEDVLRTGGLRVETTYCVPIGDAFHTVALTAPVARPRVEKLQRELYVLGFRTGPVLPIAEV